MSVNTGMTLEEQFALDNNSLYLQATALYPNAGTIWQLNGLTGPRYGYMTGIVMTISGTGNVLVGGFASGSNLTLQYGDLTLLKGATFFYSGGTADLELIFTSTSGDSTVNIPMEKLIDTYQAGTGIGITGHQVSIMLSPTAEPYINIDANNYLSLNGVGSALSQYVPISGNSGTIEIYNTSVNGNAGFSFSASGATNHGVFYFDGKDFVINNDNFYNTEGTFTVGAHNLLYNCNNDLDAPQEGKRNIFSLRFLEENAIFYLGLNATAGNGGYNGFSISSTGIFINYNGGVNPVYLGSVLEPCINTSIYTNPTATKLIGTTSNPFYAGYFTKLYSASGYAVAGGTSTQMLMADGSTKNDIYTMAVSAGYSGTENDFNKDIASVKGLSGVLSNINTTLAAHTTAIAALQAKVGI